MLQNTQYFRETALGYEKNNGIYTKAPKGSRDYYEFWDEEERRCAVGYSVGGLWIPGRMYSYLNFCPISRVPEGSNPNDRSVDKKVGFPAFWEVQLEWWLAKHIAVHGAIYKDGKHYVKRFRGDIDSTVIYPIRSIYPRNYPGGNHITCLKTRGCGFSYMEAWDGTYNYNFISASKSYYFAGIQDYLTKDGILNKCWDNLEFLNNKTIWRKNRQKKDTDMYKVASYMDDENNVKGYKSEIMGVIVDDPNKVRGKRGMKLSFEEGGSFKNLKAALEIARPLVEQGGYVAGQISIFGTGGEEGEDIEGLDDIFNEPEVNNMMAFNNIWDEGYENTDCGFFVPCDIASDMYVDIDGNPDRIAARKFWDGERDKKKKSKDQKGLDRLIAERPYNPKEALQRLTAQIFSIHDIDEQLKRIKLNRDLQGMIRHGVLVQTEEGIIFKPADVKPILEYPHRLTDDLTGCITIYESPYKDNKGLVPDGLYIAVHDPYSKDKAETSTSLGVTYIIKVDNNITPTMGDIIVASYIGRPRTKDDYNRNMFRLVEYYNAMLQSEIAGGGQDVITYAKTHKKLHLCEFEPEMIHNKELASNAKNRSYFMDMNTERKRSGLIYYADWSIRQRGITEDSNMILNIHKIYDVGLLLEMRKFNDKLNFDRISAMLIAMYMLKEKQASQAIAKRRDTGFFSGNRTLFSNTPSSNMGNLPSELMKGFK